MIRVEDYNYNLREMAVVQSQEEDLLNRNKLRPEVQFINRLVYTRTCLLHSLRGLGLLTVAWSTAVLLGGSGDQLGAKDFWFITLITLVHVGFMP